jgi:plasmid segregation protein ParM
MNVGLDIGYSDTKAVSDKIQKIFASVTGTPDESDFAFSENGAIVLESPDYVLVGAAAVRKSRHAPRWEDRDWIKTDEYYHLFLAALTEITKATSADMWIVTGLPIAFYSDKDILREIMIGEHRPERKDRGWAQIFRVKDVRVIPQPFGCLLSEAINNSGVVANANLLNGEVGIIDVGGKTTNLLSVSEASEVRPETASVSKGAWDVVRAVADWLTANTKLQPRDHQIVDHIKGVKSLKERGQELDLAPVINAELGPMAKEVIAKATQLWNGGDALDAILVSGGGAHLIGDAIKKRFPHARVVRGDPVYANALGYWRFAQHLKAGGRW